MPELYADFVRNGGTYMTLRAAGEGLHSEDLNRVQRAMLASVSVPNLLRLDIREVDFEVSLHYDITGKRMLSHSLRSDKIGMPEFYSLLLQIVTMLDECKRYMLFPANFLLDEEHIFVEDMLSCGVLHFTYVPLRDPMEDKPLSQSLLMLTTRLLTSVSRVEGEGIQHIVKFCGEERFSLPELKRMLLQLLSAGSSIEGEYSNSRHVEMGKKRSDMRLEQPAIENGRSKPNMKSDTWGASSGAIVNEYLPSNHPISADVDNWSQGGVKPEHEHWPGVEDDTVQKASIKPTYYILGALLIAALCWKFLYLDHPGSMMKYISFAVTCLLAIAVYMLWSGRLHIFGLRGQASSAMVAQEQEEAPSIEHSRHLSISSFSDFDNLSYLGQEGIKESVEFQEQGSFTGRSELPQPATVLLQKPRPAERSGQEKEESYFLDRYTAAGIGPERIPLKTGSFVIGRSEEIAQYVEGTHGVSRAHVEIMNRREGCSLKDLGSRNGTLLNGEQMAPYKEYPIKPGDVFTLAEISFKIGKEPA